MDVKTLNLSPIHSIDSDHDEKPAWLEEAAEVYSIDSRIGDCEGGTEADTARGFIDAAGIPCYLDFCEDPPEDETVAPARRWRLLVPGRFAMRATNVLDRDIFNEEFEQTWRTHLAMLSDDELLEFTPAEIFCGLIDRVERGKRAFNDELAIRGLVTNHLEINSGTLAERCG